MDNKEYLKNWRKENPNAYKEWVAANIERRREINRNWWARNKQSCSDNHKTWYSKNKDKVNKNTWTRSLWKRYKLTEEKYNEILKAQGGNCFICNEPPMKQRLSVDHDHGCCPGSLTCGNCLRGLLHVKCNSYLGWFEKHQDRTEEYLTREYWFQDNERT